ncbi:MAG: hypothetical protein ABW217_19995 [Polyangiaceae bacterium]
MLIVACGSPQGIDEDEFPDQYAGQASASGGTGATPPVGNAGGTGGSAGTGSGGTSNLGGSSGAPASNGGSGGGGSGGTGNAQGTGGTGGGTPGTGGTGGGQQPPPAGNCPDDMTVLFSRSSAQGGCGDAGCHTPGDTSPDLVSPNVAMRLLNVASGCQSRPFISASDSFLLEKIEDISPACGSQMPFFATQNLSAADRQCIVDWIDEVGGGG